MEPSTSTLLHEDADLAAPILGTSYEADPHAWAMQQADLIRQRRFDELDIENLADEVEDVARRERKELVGRLSLVVQHLLKWDHQAERRSASWARTIREQRRQVNTLLDEAPSLRARLAAMTDEAFRQGRVAMLNETQLPDETVPETNAYPWDDLMGRPIRWPEP